LGIFHIILILMLSALTTKIIIHVQIVSQVSYKFTMIGFSLIYMSLLIYECLKLISHVDQKKYYYSNILNPNEKRFLENEYDEISNGFQIGE
jgi:hypothetical protein